MTTLIANGTIITADKTVHTNILISDGKIKEIGNISSASHIIDASGCYVIPGAIDPHVHLFLPTPAGYSVDDFYTGTKAALLGGTTTVLDFVTPFKGQSLVEALNIRKNDANQALTDYSFHVSPVEWTKDTEHEIISCINQGITSFKVYLAYKKSIGLDFESLKKVMLVVAKHGGLVTLHCEMGDEIEALRDTLYNKGFTSAQYHEASRPVSTEADAVKKAITIAEETQCPIYIVHVSAKESLAHIKNAQEKGLKVYAETCPHYLVLNKSKYHGSFVQTAKYVISPPLRQKEDNIALWQALKSNTIKTIGTDHCPFNNEQKAFGKDDFRKIPNGAGSIEHRLPLTFTYGVLENKISLNEWVDKISTQPAKIFGLYPKKGSLQVGADADITIWDPSVTTAISAKTHYHSCNNDIYEGIETKGAAKHVIKNGVIEVEDYNYNNTNAFGMFLSRKPFS